MRGHFARHNLAACALVIGIAIGSTPVITSVSPTSPLPGPKPQTLTVNGQDFQPDLSIAVTDPVGQTTIAKGPEIVARQSTSFQFSTTLATSGTYTLVITNKDGGVSKPFELVVKSGPADEPVIERVMPSDLVKRPDAQPLRVEGQRFANGLSVIVGDPMGSDVTDVSVSKVTPTSFELNVRLEHSGEYSLIVKNPSGAVSKAFQLMVR